MKIVPLPTRGRVQLSDQGLLGIVEPGQVAIAMEQCCTVENKRTITLVKVVPINDQGPGSRAMLALTNELPGLGPYSTNQHLIAAHAQALPAQQGKVWVASLFDRVVIPAIDHDQLAGFRAMRVARMTVLARAKFRAKISQHWARPEPEDATWLVENGYNPFGQPSAT